MAGFPQDKSLLSCLLRPAGARRLNHYAKQTCKNVDETKWLRDPLGAAEKRRNKDIGYFPFQTNVVHMPRQKIIKEIITRRKRAEINTNDENSSLYELGEEYLELEHQTHATLTYQTSIVDQKINQILQKRFNYNPVARSHKENEARLVEMDNINGSKSVSVQYGNAAEIDNRSNVDGGDNLIHVIDDAISGDNEIDDTALSSDQTRTNSLERERVSRILDMAQKGVLPNATLLKIDITNLRKTNQQVTQDIFDKLDATRVNYELLRLWTHEDVVDLIYYNKALVPLLPNNPELQYDHLRNKTAMFDKGYVLPIHVEGKHAETFLEHFITCSLNKLKEGTIQYTCILDTKGFIMDTAYVAKTKDSFIIMTNGLNKKNLYEYITAYMVTCRNSGLSVSLKPLIEYTTISLQGPKTFEVLNFIANTQQRNGRETQVGKTDEIGLGDDHSHPSLDINSVPQTFMQYFTANFKYVHEDQHTPPTKKEETIQCFRVSDVGEDGLELLVTSEAAPHLARLLMIHPDLLPAGFKIYDTGRMEAGILRSDVDLPAEPSPIQAAVAWSVDKQKLRNGSLFGRQHLISQIINGVAKVRVGLIANHKMDSLCNILHNDTRMPIGFVTSCTWSYGLEMYIAQAYMRKEYARHDMVTMPICKINALQPVCISMPCKPETPTTKKDYRKYYRNMTRRQFIRGTVVHLPFILHNYPISKAERQYVGGRNVTLQNQTHANATKTCNDSKDGGGTSSMESMNENENPSKSAKEPAAENADGSQPKGTTVKSRKQLWKEVIQAQRKRNTKTLEMALQHLEKAKTNPTLGRAVVMDTTAGGRLLHIDRINIRPRGNVPLRECLTHYRDQHSKPIVPRHRRYRPPGAQKQTYVN